MAIVAVTWIWLICSLGRRDFQGLHVVLSTEQMHRQCTCHCPTGAWERRAGGGKGGGVAVGGVKWGGEVGG